MKAISDFFQVRIEEISNKNSTPQIKTVSSRIPVNCEFTGLKPSTLYKITISDFYNNAFVPLISSVTLTENEGRIIDAFFIIEFKPTVELMNVQFAYFLFRPRSSGIGALQRKQHRGEGETQGG